MGIGNQDETAFAFEGSWREYAPIAVTNLFLTIVTLGIYRFWATTRERQYLWRNTRFIDDHLEWTGLGKELLIGFLFVTALITPPLIFLNVYFQRMLLNGQAGLAVSLFFLIYLFLLFLGGLARFRGLRYRLSRTYWHGIHGGSDNPGFRYGFSYLWKYAVGYLAFGLLVPWSMVRLWKERWQGMSFGPLTFESTPRWENVMKRYLLFYLSPILILVGGIIVAIPVGLLTSLIGDMDSPIAILLIGLGSVVLTYGMLGLIAIAFYAKFFREVVNTLSLGALDFEFTARSSDWFKFIGVTVLIYIVALSVAAAILSPFVSLDALKQYMETGGTSTNIITILAVGLVASIPLGFAAAINQFRNWRFFIRFLEAGGEVSLDAFTQSTTKSMRQGEGLLDAFDMGAI
jgi:uncharacterized membrane protein YjgN (DUF898 family)